MGANDWLDGFKPYPAATYATIDLNRLIAFTLWKLEREKVFQTFESITVAAFRLFPEKFSLVGFPDFPDATRSNRALLQLRPKYRNWATGEVGKGWTLTPLGLQQVEETSRILEGKQPSEKPLPGPRRTRNPKTELAAYKEKPLYRRFQSGDRTKPHKLEAFDYLDAVPYSPPKVLRRYVDNIRQLARESRDEEALAFVKWFEEVNNDVLKEKEESA